MKPLWTAVAFLSLVAVPAHALTPQQVSEGFIKGVVDYCLKATLAGSSISALAEADRVGLSQAPEQEKMMLGPQAKDAPAWGVAPAAGNVVAYEPAAGVCKVFAYGPPVELTFSEVLRRVQKTAPDFTETHPTPGYDPIVFGLERTQADKKITIQLSGAEPGTPGHAFRFSTLKATVTLTPVIATN